MNKAEAFKRLEEIEQEKVKLEEIINKPERWQDGLVQPDKERYFYLLDTADEGLVVCGGSKSKRKPEHAFRTREQAELMAEKCKLMIEMHQFAHVRNKAWKADWGSSSQVKFGIEDAPIIEFVDEATTWNRFIFGIAVKSREIAEEMLSIFGERIEAIYNKQY